MPDNGSGTYTRSNGTATGDNVWAQDEAASRKITSPLHDAHDQDVADALNNRLCKDGQNAMTGDLDMGGQDIINIGSGGKTLAVPNAGTWLPTIVGSTTPGTYSYSQQDGNYTEIGDDVWFSIHMQGTWSSDPAGDLRISLPFAVATGRTAIIADVKHVNLDADSNLLGMAGSTNAYLTLNSYTTNGNTSTVTFADQISNLHELIVQGKFIKA